MPGISTASSASTSDPLSGFTNAFADTESDHLHHPSTIHNNLFAGSSEDIMNRVRYRPVDTRGDQDVDTDAHSRLHHRVRSTNSLASTYSSSAASDDGFTDEQFLLHSSSSKKIPYKAIGLAALLFFLGTVMCIIGGLLLSGIYIDQRYNDRTWPVLCLGLIMFIPGSYHIRIAYYAWKRVPGFQYSDIPDWD